MSLLFRAPANPVTSVFANWILDQYKDHRVRVPIMTNFNYQEYLKCRKGIAAVRHLPISGCARHQFAINYGISVEMQLEVEALFSGHMRPLQHPCLTQLFGHERFWYNERYVATCDSSLCVYKVPSNNDVNKKTENVEKATKIGAREIHAYTAKLKCSAIEAPYYTAIARQGCFSLECTR